MEDFAQKFPTSIFLELMGLPVEELAQFMKWESALLHTSLGTPEEVQA
ncbi:cytochrome P450 [Nocardioides sp. cx-169]|nr:cytochrome P450 [Nocardioides sp. cx-169]MCD4533059.1 cytochrome P450 [Nocardioides sp. cx-169]